MALRFTVHAHPGSKAPSVGGDHGGALVVRTRARAVDGRANDEVVHRLATAFAVRGADVRIIRGAASRSQVVEVLGDATSLSQRLNELLGSTKPRP